MPSAQNPPRAKSKDLHHPETKDQDFYVHPYLTPDNDPCKGRFLRASSAVPSGTVLLVDTSYATVPDVEPTRNDALICSNLPCSRRVAQQGLSVRCPENCFKNVAWCNATCRAADLARHSFECSWLKHMGETIRREEGQYNFVTLWHVVRLLAGRVLEAPSDHLDPIQRGPWGRNWESVEQCCSYLDSWPEAQIKHWTRLIERYLSDTSVLPGSLRPEEMLSLICKEETNTFGLYEKTTGPLHTIDHPEPRGESYGLSLFPRAAMFNHSCIPNVSHKPDDRGRMIYTAARNIAAGEECNITYFDLTAFGDLSARQTWTKEQFQFTCTCERCLEETARENLAGIDFLPFSDF